MNTKAWISLVAAALASCAAPPSKPAWTAKPLLDIRHGMAAAAAHYQLGRYQEAHGQKAAAIASYERAVAADPGHPDALDALGALHAERGDLGRAADVYRRLAESSPKRAHLLNNIGHALALQGRHGEAVDAFRQALAISPEYERAWVNLVRAARAGGMAEVAALAERRLLVPPAESMQAAAAAGKPAADELPGGSGAESGPLAAEAPAIFRQETTPQGSAPLAALATPPSVPVISSGNALAARIELANGNGIGGFAAGVRLQLRDWGIGVVRLTNFPGFGVRRSVIEYRAGFAGEAALLQSRLGGSVAVREATAARPGTDLRLILGADRAREGRPPEVAGRVVRAPG